MTENPWLDGYPLEAVITSLREWLGQRTHAHA
jgi:hypothetical protein